MNQPNHKKEVVIIAGANGSGKTTFAHKYLDATQYEFLNADEIAKALSPANPEQARIAAGKTLIKRIDELILEGKSFVLESTLSGSSLEEHIKELKQADYEINLIFIFLGSEELCVERIKSRVLQGGHNVPTVDVYRRYKRGLKNFWNKYKSLADYYSIVYNHENYEYTRIARGKNSKYIEIFDQELFGQFLTEIKEKSDGE